MKVINNRYELLEEIGRGGFGVTWKGRDTLLDIPLAIKEFTDTDEERKAKFLREAKILVKFAGNPGIVTVRDFLEEDGRAYMVMEYLDGIDLKQHILRSGPMDFSSVLTLLGPVIDGLASVHEAGVLHKDISPDNIRIMADGSVKLLDFGSATPDMSSPQKDAVTHTVMLKPGYAPVEQYMGKRSTEGPWTDIYALCSTIYMCITGRTPMDSLQRSFRDELEAPSALEAVISPEEETVLLRGMALRPEDRYQSVAELREALQQAEAGTKPSEPEPTEVKPAEEVPVEPVFPTAEPIEEKPVETPPVIKPAKTKKKPIKEKPERKTRQHRKKKKGSKSWIMILLLAAVAVAAIAGFLWYRSSQSGYVDLIGEKVTASDIKKMSITKPVTSLSLRDCKVEDEAIKAIGKSSVEDLTLDNCTGFTTLDPLAQSATLETLEFDNFQGLKMSALITKPMTTVHELVLNHVNLTDGSGFASCFPAMVSFRGEDYSGLDSIDFVADMPALTEFVCYDDLKGKVEALGKCTNLQSLTLQNAGADSLEWIGKLTGLVSLDLSGNNIQNIRPLADLPNLEVLNLGNNRIQSLDGISSQVKLKSLRVNDNNLTDANFMENFGMLYLLDVRNNQISDLSSLSGKMPDLKALLVSGNKLTSLAFLQDLSGIYVVMAGDNDLKNISGLENKGELKALTLNNNQITDLSPLASSLDNLEYLDLACNMLSDISVLGGVKSDIQCIMLEHNQISDISMLPSMTWMEKFTSYDNKISDPTPLAGWNYDYGDKPSFYVDYAPEADYTKFQELVSADEKGAFLGVPSSDQASLMKDMNIYETDCFYTEKQADEDMKWYRAYLEKKLNEELESIL